MARGGYRAGAGRPKGSIDKGTAAARAEKEALRQMLREKVAEHMGPLVEAQVANARGLKYLVARDTKTGKFERISQRELEAILSGKDSKRYAIEVWEKDPSVQAFTDLMNRTLDKPTEHVEMNVSSDDERMAKLMAGRKRAAKEKK
jgi:hypothetical protein